jgi:hypothetical protein
LTLTNKSLFSLSTPHPDLYLVLFVYRVLRGDEDAASDPYYKASVKKKINKNHYVIITNQSLKKKLKN